MTSPATYEPASGSFHAAYPCIKAFPMPDGTIIYDSKANFATLFSIGSLEMLKLFLGSTALNEDRRYLKARNPDLYAILEKLLSRGVFLPGPMKNIYMTGDQGLKDSVDYYEKNILPRKFSLEVTRRCNLRCRYCPYSAGDGNRKHEDLDLSEQDALAAIDSHFGNYSKLFSELNPGEKAKALKKAPPGIGWYGGEPFLNFPLIKKTMRHFLSKPWGELGIEKKYYHLAVTTNFTEVSDEILDFLAEHDIFCTVSLDGPKAENDKYRVFARGSASVFDAVVGNLERLAKKHPEYLREKVLFSSVYGPEHQYGKCDEFFSGFQRETGIPVKFGRYRPQEMSKPGQIIPDPERKIEHIDLELKNKGAYQNPFLGKSKKEILEMARTNSTLSSDIETWRHFLAISVDNPSGSDSWNTQLNCPIGFDALLVSADGKLHPCERTDQSLPIGDLRTGRDKRVIADVYKRLNSLFDNDRCKSCWAIHSCKVCIAQLLKGSEMRLLNAEECEFMRKSAELEMGRFFKCSAENPALAEAVGLHEERVSGLCDLQMIREESRNELGKTGILKL